MHTRALIPGIFGGMFGGMMACIVGLACQRPSTTDSTPPDPPAPTVEPEPAVPEPVACGTPGLRMSALGFVPLRTRMLATLALDDPALPTALGHLGAHLRGGDRPVPIDLAFSIAQWSWQVPLVVGTLDRIGLRPAQLVAVQLPDRLPVWVLPCDCDFELLERRLTAAYGLRMRRTLDGAIASAPAGFAYDVVVLPGLRLALVPAGRGNDLLTALGDPDLGALEGPRLIPPGERLEQLAAAPVRIVIRGRALLDPDVPLDAPAMEHTLRADASGVTTDDTVAPSS